MQIVEYIVVEAWPPRADKPENCGIILIPSGEGQIFCRLKAQLRAGDSDLQSLYGQMAAQLMEELNGDSAVEIVEVLESTASNFLRLSNRQTITLPDAESITTLLQDLYKSKTGGGVALAARAG